jgi:hypothetical protein
LDDLNKVGSVDAVWVLGDLAAFGPDPAECIWRARDLADTYGKDNVRYVRGNTDRYLVRGERPANKPAEDEDTFKQMLSELAARDAVLNWTLAQLRFADYEFLAKLDGEVALEAAGYGWVIGYHGTPGDDEGYLRPETADEEAQDSLMDREGRLGIGGHIHVQMDRDLGSWRAVNVGSIGMSYDHPGEAEWGLFTFEEGRLTVDLRRVPYRVDTFIKDLHGSGHPAPDWTIGKARLR